MGNETADPAARAQAAAGCGLSLSHRLQAARGSEGADAARCRQTLCADIDGFSLHAAVRCGTDDRQALEQLCRYVTRPALANERVQTKAAGQVVFKLKTPGRDGTTHLVMSPLEFMQRLANTKPNGPVAVVGG